MATRSPAAADLTAFIEAFDEFIAAAKRARHRWARTSDNELSPAQFGLLAPLLDAPAPLGVRALAQAAGVSSPTATRMLAALESRGLVTRQRCSNDRRAVLHALTPEGTREVRTQRRRALATRRAIFESLEPDEREMAAQMLARLARAYDEVRR